MTRARARDARDAPQDHIADDFGSRHELALHWLYHESMVCRRDARARRASTVCVGGQCDDVEATTAEHVAGGGGGADFDVDIDDNETSPTTLEQRLLAAAESAPLDGRLDDERA